jgi:L-ascorbate metabolism protein UlaG (beta-lactamase superfamily)
MTVLTATDLRFQDVASALVGELLGARTVVPIHYGGFGIDPFYRPVADPSARFEQAAAGRPYVTRVLEPGESFASVSDAVAG